MKTFSEILVIFLASVNLLLTWPALIGLKQPTTLPLWMIRVFTSALSPLLFLFGLTMGIFGFVISSLPAILIGSCSALLFLIHILRITRPPDPTTGFEHIFGSQWKEHIPREIKVGFLQNRYTFLLKKSTQPIFKQNIPFYTIPGTDRQLLCDIWQPPKNIKHSGLAFIYLHGPFS
jgi:hypothetical protein